MIDPYYIRPLTEWDIPKLIDIRPGFKTNVILQVQRLGEGYTGGWQLVEVEIDPPYEKGHGYDFDATERESIRGRFAQDNTLLEVVVERDSERVVGIVDVEEREWNSTAWVWNLMLDEDVRSRGLGNRLVQRTMAWAKKRGLRAVMLETQTNNVPACRFYARMGFQLVGINEVLYTNDDLQNNEVAIFWSLPVR
ncbi:MAG: GNAT family N-acetyltransferase [Chloroflexi bacterium]|nr:GNAT family N-acetyltransferase [Chloroflexota bacterium]